MDEKCAHKVIESMKNTLGLTVLGWGIGTGEPKQSPMGGLVGYGGVINELSTIISLETFNMKAELCASVCNKINHVSVHTRLLMQR